MVPVYLTKSVMTEAEMRRLPAFQLGHDVQEVPVVSPIRVVLVKDPDWLHFLVSRKGPAHCTDTRTGVVIEGLWEQDVAEIFIHDDSGFGYREFNLSPYGSWWTCHFDRPRMRSLVGFPMNAIPSGTVDESQWKASLKIPLQDLAVEAKLQSSSRMNVTAIVDRGPRRHMSLTPHGKIIPNFHREDLFSPVLFQEIESES